MTHILFIGDCCDGKIQPAGGAPGTTAPALIKSSRARKGEVCDEKIDSCIGGGRILRDSDVCNGRRVTAYLELPGGLAVDDIDLSTVVITVDGQLINGWYLEAVDTVRVVD